MTGFIIGVLVGGFFGVVIMCIMSVASQYDRSIDDFDVNLRIVNKDKE